MNQPHIVLLTHSGSPELTRDDRHLADALQGLATVVSLPWDDPDTVERIPGSDAVVIRSTWNYTERLPEFLAFLDAVGRTSTSLFNHAAVVQWNCDKHYLAQLEQDGVAVLPTAYARRGSTVNLGELLAERAWDDVVIKPTVSATAKGLFRAKQSNAKEQQVHFERALAQHDLMIQPLAPEVARDGEWSLMFFGGRYSHAVRKRAALGDIRVQSDFGGTSQPESPPEALVADAEQLLDAVHRRFPKAEPLLYARVDGIERNGRLVLMELELIEPELFFRHDDAAAQTFAQHLLQRL